MQLRERLRGADHCSGARGGAARADLRRLSEWLTTLSGISG